MKIILFQDNSIDAIDRYINDYEEYFFNLYTDTGIFSEETIRESYVREARDRRDNIFKRIVERLSPNIVLGHTPENTLFIPWRSKVLSIAWRDEGNTRIVIDLRIYKS